MNRPDKRNAIDQQMADELSAAFDMFDAEPVFRVAVLTGTSQLFSAGTDMKEPRSPATSNGGSTDSSAASGASRSSQRLRA